MLFPDKFNIWLNREPTDMRKAIQGLSLLVVDNFKTSLQTGDMFIFYNKRKDKIKIIYWHYNGFCLLQKSLDKSAFKIPDDLDKDFCISKNQLLRLFDGLYFINKKAGMPGILY